MQRYAYGFLYRCTSLDTVPLTSRYCFKVLPNEKRGGLKAVPIYQSNRSRFQLFTSIVSSKSVQASSFEKPKTTQQSMFLLFECNNCIGLDKNFYLRKAGRIRSILYLLGSTKKLQALFEWSAVIVIQNILLFSSQHVTCKFPGFIHIPPLQVHTMPLIEYNYCE